MVTPPTARLSPLGNANWELPSFKVTQRLRGGLTVHRSVPRGRGPPAPSHPDCVIDSNDEECGVDGAVLESTVDVDEDVSLHADSGQPPGRQFPLKSRCWT